MRTALTNGKWFDKSKAEKFTQKTYWNGSNAIGKYSGSQWVDSYLYRTASGAWVLETSPRIQGHTTTFEEFTNKQAADWFVKNEFQEDEIPAEIAALIEAELKGAEL